MVRELIKHVRIRRVGGFVHARADMLLLFAFFEQRDYDYVKFNMASCHGAAASIAQREAFMMQKGRERGLTMRVSSLLQLQSALLSQKIMLHNPFMSRKVADTLLVQCFRLVCMSDVTCHILQLSKLVIPNTRKDAVPPPPVINMGLKHETIVQFLFTELEDIVKWLRPDLVSPTRVRRVSEFLTHRTETMMRMMRLSTAEAQHAFRKQAVVRFLPECAARHGSEVDGWRCTCARCNAWNRLTDKQWQTFCERVLRDFPWFQVILNIELEYKENLKTIRKVPVQKMNEIIKQLEVKDKLQRAVQEVKSGTIQKRDSVLQKYLVAMKEAASEVAAKDADVAVEM